MARAQLVPGWSWQLSSGEGWGRVSGEVEGQNCRARPAHSLLRAGALSQPPWLQAPVAPAMVALPLQVSATYFPPQPLPASPRATEALDLSLGRVTPQGPGSEEDTVPWSLLLPPPHLRCQSRIATCLGPAIPAPCPPAGPPQALLSPSSLQPGPAPESWAWCPQCPPTCLSRRPWLCPQPWGKPRPPGGPLTWGLCGAGLQVAGLPAHGLHQRVASADDVGPLVALHIPHPHAHPAGLGALTQERQVAWQSLPSHLELPGTQTPQLG